jgi:hypothetical protein
MFSIGTILQWSTLGCCNLDAYENEFEEVAFIRQRSGEPLKWRQFDEISHNIEDKIHCTVSKLHETWLKIFFSHLSLCKSTTTGWYLRDSAIKSKQDGKIWLSWGVSEIKCIIFKENNDNPYENYNNYIKLSIVFHPMIIFVRK